MVNAGVGREVREGETLEPGLEAAWSPQQKMKGYALGALGLFTALLAKSSSSSYSPISVLSLGSCPFEESCLPT